MIKPREKSERNFKWILIILCAAAEATNIYLAYEYLTFNFNYCSINQGWWSWLNCGTVGESGHTSLFGIQFWAMGLVWFPLVLLVGLFLSKQVLLLLLVVGDMSTILLLVSGDCNNPRRLPGVPCSIHLQLSANSPNSKATLWAGLE